jgi:hypothetical protein
MHAADRPPRAPALHQDRQRANAAGGASPALLIIALLTFIGIIAFFILVRA